MLRRAFLGLYLLSLGGCLSVGAASLRGCTLSKKPDLRVDWMGPKKRKRGPKKCQMGWIESPLQLSEASHVQYGRISLRSWTFYPVEEQAVLSWACQLGGSHILRLASKSSRIQKFSVLKRSRIAKKR